MVGVQDLKHKTKTIGWEIGFKKKSSEPENHFRIRIIPWLSKPVPQIRLQLASTELSLLLVKKSVYHWDGSHTKILKN